jgi:Fis family transcriptional regulator
MTANAGNVVAIEVAAHTETGTEPPLGECVRAALRQYFTQLDGHEATGLHAMVIAEVEKPLIETVLEQCGHNQSKAAQVLGLSRSTLRKKMTQYGIG